MKQEPKPSLDQVVHDPSLALDMAYAEKPYRELEIHARELNLGDIATDMALRANRASEAVREQSQDTSLKPTTQLGGNTVDSASGLKIKYVSFEQAQKAEKRLSDSFVDGAISDKFSVGGERGIGIKRYLDTVELTQKDKDVIDDPERIAGLYVHTTEMLARNLKVVLVNSGDSRKDQRRWQHVKRDTEIYHEALSQEVRQAASQIKAWCKGETSDFPVGAIRYQGFLMGGQDVLNAEMEGVPDVRPNIKIQRQFGGTFIMGYSDARVHEKITGDDEVLDKRIYLNPETEAAPKIFEQILHAANRAGVSMQLKMLQRAREAAKAHMYANEGRALGGLRGDGIVVYVGARHANDLLGAIIAIAQENPEEFKYRKTSRIAQSVADGIAIGDEPIKMPGKSLTSHRVMILEHAARVTRESGLKGEDARDMFRDMVRRTAIANGVNPLNLAFNQ